MYLLLSDSSEQTLRFQGAVGGFFVTDKKMVKGLRLWVEENPVLCTSTFFGGTKFRLISSIAENLMKKGFTLVELMIVVTILGILAAIVLPEFQGHATESRESSAKSSLHAVRAQIELYKMQHNGLAPGYIGAIQAPLSSLYNQFIGTSTITGMSQTSKTPSGSFLYGPYLTTMPANPFNNLPDVKMVPSGTTDFSTAADDSTGWLYQKETATFKINKSGTDSQGDDYVDY